MYNIAIVEDDCRAASELKNYIARYSEEKSCPFKIYCYRSTEDFMVYRQIQYDIVFFDIELPGMNGMEGAKRFRQTDSVAVIIFITNLAKYALCGYEVGAMAYIVKPVKYQNLALILDKAIHTIRCKQDKFITVSNSEGLYKLNLEEILYLEINDHSIVFHTDSGEVKVAGSLNDYEIQLKSSFFARCNSCYLVNLGAVSKINGNAVYLCDGTMLNISRRKKKDFANEFLRYMGNG